MGQTSQPQSAKCTVCKGTGNGPAYIVKPKPRDPDDRYPDENGRSWFTTCAHCNGTGREPKKAA